MSTATLSPADTVANVLEGYAARGVFRGFSRRPARNGRVVFKMLWHRDRPLELIFDSRRHTLRFPLLLPAADPSTSHELQGFLKERHLRSVPEHRRIDRRKASMRCSIRGGGIAVSLTVKGGDYEYGAHKLIHIVNEIFMTFLSDGRYHDYVVRMFDLEPDAV